MKSRLLLFALLVGVVVAIPVAASAIPVPPFETNTSCLECHDVAAGGPVISTVDFSAASVDLTKCNACHWVQNHYPHGSFVQCNSCHYSMPTRTDFFNSSVSTPYGFFASAVSPSLDPALIHEAHANGSWPKGVTTHPTKGQPVYCASCHAPAACDACHGTVPHGNHTAAAPGDPYPGVTRTVARGATPAQYSTTNTTVSETSRCINPSCHDVAGVPGAIVRAQFEENSPLVTYAPLWDTELSLFYSGGQLFYTGRAGYKANITVSGPGIVRVYGLRDAFGGLADVTVDGGSPTRVDFFSNATQYNALVFQTDDLSVGLHTITITALGRRTLGSGGNSVYLDVVRVLNLTGASFKPDCTDCHADRKVTHGYDSVDHVADVGASSNPGEPACGTCHEMDVLTEHERSSSSSAGGTCGTCHPAPRDTYGDWDQSCEQGGCHAAGSATGKHADMASDHTPPSAGAVCAECHAGDLGAVHVDASVTDGAGTRTTCNVCHTTTTVPTTNDCTVCHFTFDGHYDAAVHTSTWTLAGCDSAGCHPTRDLMDAHTDKNAAFTCFGCHSSSDPIVVAAIDDGDTACGTCHTSVSQTDSHRAVHWANPPLVGGVTPTPFYSYYTGSAGTSPTKDCAGCHVSNLVDEHIGVFENGQWTRVPRTDSAGAALTCATCHASLDSATMTAIALGQTKCDACHVVHGPIGKVHKSTYVANPDIDCSGCHSVDLTVVHNGYMTTTTPSGRVLSGCELCHAYTEGDLGQRVQDAIAVTNDTKCDACHLAYHEGSTSHGASAPESVDDCGTCHGTVEAGVLDVVSIHAGVTSPGPCKVCHNNPTRVVDLTTKSAECASCHATVGTDYHRNMDVHVSPDAALCSGQCHHRNPDVTVVHTAGCTTCHTTVNTEGITTACTNCHLVQGEDYHENIDAAHTTSDAPSTDCIRCHGDTPDVRKIHTTLQCATCHNSLCVDCHTVHSPAPGSALLKVMACSTCHAVSGTEYHRTMNDKHTFGAMDPGCVSAGCHAANTLPEAHAPYLDRYPQYTDTCALCHLNTGDTRVANGYPPIDWATASADCSTCHTVHGDITTIHTAPASQECVDCHETADVRTIHGATQAASCVVCHDGRTLPATTKCTSCHAYSPVDTKHYPTAEHAASDAGCDQCHYTDLKTEHFKSSAGPVSCVQCHETYVDGFTAPWDDSCAACHAVKHDRQADDHVSTRTDCAGSGCHDVGDVSVVHAGLSGGGCSACHTGPATPPTTTDCTSSGCHSAFHAGKTVAHTATTPASLGCGRCHDKDPLAGVNVEPVHAAAPEGACWVCHGNPARVPDVSLETAECASCHGVSGTEYHRTMNAKHTFGAMDPSCVSAGCHAAKTLPEAHAPYLARYPQYTDTCALCHLNADAGRIDWATASADCSTCHTVHGDITTIHTAPASQECVDCHETADVRTIHGATQAASCVVCHDGRTLPATTQCTNCHAYSPVDTKHYPTAPHLAVTASGCSNCHSLDLKTEHFKSSAGPVSCVQCHETYVDAFTAPWDKSCEKCHPTKHGQQQNKHRSTRTDCAGSGCHVVTDVAAIHSALADGGCSACHKSATSPATTTDCGAAGCHPTATPGHHESHNAATYNPTGCKGCHFMYLDDEHIKLGMTCDTCHKSTNTLVKSAIANRDRKCLTCHPTSPHNQRQAYEFAPGNASMHRVSADLPGMRSTFYVNGGTYTWSLPPASSFLKTGYAINSMVTCDSCHTYSGADGPHGAAMKVNIDPAYPTVWTSSKLTRSGNGMNPSTIICAKCHTNLGSSNGVHNDGHHAGDYCNSCHVSIPHGWGRPRLIGYTTDPAPYKARSGGLIAMKLKNYSYSSGWNESDCYAGCDDHEKTVSPIWPNSGTGTPPPTTGTVTGRITDAATGANLSGASVSLSSGATGTSGSDGMYTLTNVIAGTYTMTVSKSGYATKTQSITVNVGQTTTANVALTTSASGGNLALGKTFTASRFESSTYAPNKAGDGDSATYWWSRRDGKKDDTEWLRVDLGSSLSVSSAEIQWFGDYFAKEFRVHTSTDGSTWVKVYETSSGSSGTKTVTFSSRMARYVRVECRRTGNDRDTGYGIAELRVFK